MNFCKKVMIITYFGEDISWIRKINFKVIIFNKTGKKLDYKKSNLEIIDKKNIGGNQYDLLKYIYDNYYKLPKIIINTQGNPFDHCKKEIFFKKIQNNQFDSLESIFKNQEKIENKSNFRTQINNFFFQKKNKLLNDAFMEINCSWYINYYNRMVKKKLGYYTCKIKNLDQFLNKIFSNYRSLPYIPFAPGSQYILEDWRCLKYSRKFWKQLINFFPKENINGGTEAHIIERAMWLIFSGLYQMRKEISIPKPQKIYKIKSDLKSSVFKKLMIILKYKVFS
jgi:hypothetical protein